MTKCFTFVKAKVTKSLLSILLQHVFFSLSSLPPQPIPSPPGAQHRGLAPSWCHHGAADRVAKAACDGFALVETGETVEFVAATAACGRQPPACRLTRFTSCSRRARPLPASPFAPAENPASCHAHPFRFHQSPFFCRSPLHGHAHDVQCEMARQCSLA